VSSERLSYAAAGVDIAAYEKVLERVKPLIAATHGREVASGIGPFAGVYELPGGGRLAASADGVGTKIKVAIAAGSHRGIGNDIVNHCVNDIACAGARPLFFMDYFATGMLDPEVFEQLIEGMTEACREAGCALLGGETAEMPGFYADGEYDIAGTIVGVVEKSKVIDGRSIVSGDVLIGLSSDGLHTNGYSLARRVMFDVCGFSPDTRVPELGTTAGDALLAPHRSYLKPVRPLIEAGLIKGMSHITGGGITENVPRILPEGTAAAIDRSTWTVPPLFRLLQDRGGIADEEMFRAFNMGIGLVIVCAAEQASRAVDALTRAGEQPVRLGAIVAGQPSVQYRRTV